MKITIITTGSRGDVEPFVALAEGLIKHGHTVTIASEARFETFITGRGLGFALISGDTFEAINSVEGQKALSKRNNTQPFYNHLINSAAPYAQQILQQCIDACKNADHIITAPYYIYPSYFIARELSKPLTVAGINAIAISQTRHFHNLLLPPPGNRWPAPVQKMYNTFSHKLIRHLMWQSITQVYGTGWKNITGRPLPKANPFDTTFFKNPPLCLYGYSPAMLPKPVDWQPHQHVTGYWLLKPESNFSPPPALENFLAAGPPPVYIGFGSMNNSLLKNGALEKMILEMVGKTKQRAVILKQGLSLDSSALPPHVFATDPVPFAWLFPKMAALVHHGGAGTIAAGLAAGVPSITTPLIVDQKFWAWCLEKSGAGSKPVPWHSLSAHKLADAVSAVMSNASLRQRAQTLGKKIAEENGVENAVEAFNKAHFEC